MCRKGSVIWGMCGPSRVRCLVLVRSSGRRQEVLLGQCLGRQVCAGGVRRVGPVEVLGCGGQQ